MVIKVVFLDTTSSTICIEAKPHHAEQRAAKREANKTKHARMQEEKEAKRLEDRAAFIHVVMGYIAGGFSPDQIAPLVKREVKEVRKAIRLWKRGQATVQVAA